MTNTKHTKQEWLRQNTTIYALEHHGWHKGEEQFRNRWTAGVQGYRDTPKEEVESVARLMQAAPTLLAACQTAFDALESAAARDPASPQAKALAQLRAAIYTAIPE